MAKTQDESNANGERGWQVSRPFLRFWDSLIIFIILIVILLVVFRIVIGNMSSITSTAMSYMISEESTEEPAEESAEEPAEAPPNLETEISPYPVPTETLLATPEPEYGEVTDKTMDTTNKKLGEVELSIPRLISPKSSNIISLSVYRPSKLASADLTTFLIVEIGNEDIKTISTLHGALFTENRTILVDERMKVELVASAFEIEPLFPEIQAVDLDTIGEPTHWAWSIIAPEAEGVHILNFKVYVDEESDTPSWLGAYQIEVMEPAPIQSDTPKPSPNLSISQASDMTRIIDSTKFLLDLLAVASTIIGGVFAIIRPYIKRRVALTENNMRSEPTSKIE